MTDTSEYVYYDDDGKTHQDSEPCMPTLKLRWVLFGQERMLQQLFMTNNRRRRWFNVPEIEVVP